MKPQLTDAELRVLGVLIEKSLTQPDSYPLTLNAIVLGACQKQNRDPVVDYLEADVARGLQGLIEKRLAKQSAPAIGARANRFEHTVVERLHWDRREQAVMAELMLRGRQTVGELRSRATRMTSFPDLRAVQAILDEMSKGEQPLVIALPREPGRATIRYRHLLSAEKTEEVVPSRDAAGVDASVPDKGPGGMPVPASGLEERVERLEARVDELAGLVDKLRKNQGEPIDGQEAPSVQS